MRHASLFSGIGGFDLAAEWMGWTNVFNCEWEDFPRKVLKHHFPNAIQYGDIRELDATKYRGRLDILTGGFPCQPYSMAGKRLGKDDERHLWPEMLRIICEVQPRYVVGENVRGLISWNGGLVFDEVQSDLEVEGYEVLPFVLPACAVNAPHRRDRIFFVAHAASHRRERQGQGVEIEERLQQRPEPTRKLEGRFEGLRDLRDASDTDSARLQRRKVTGGTKKSGKERDQQPFRCVRQTWENFPTEPPICGGNDGLPRELDGITFSKWRNESIKAYGNAIVPQVALQIFKAIQETDRHD